MTAARARKLSERLMESSAQGTMEAEVLGLIEEMAEKSITALRPDLRIGPADETDDTTNSVIPLLLRQREMKTLMDALAGRYTPSSARRDVGDLLVSQLEDHAKYLKHTMNALNIVIAAREAERRLFQEQVREANLTLAMLGTDGEKFEVFVNGNVRRVAVEPNLSAAARATKRLYGAEEAALIFLDVMAAREGDEPELPADVMARLVEVIAERDPDMGKHLGKLPLPETAVPLPTKDAPGE